MTFSRGALFGSYEIAEPIGSGGMGEVYRARDTTLGRDVAIKVLPASFSNDAMRVARFEQEAKTLASLNHANIAHIYGLERSAGGTGIVMELVDGETLVDRLVQGPIPVDEVLRIATQIADALEAAHERATVHRDLKPANVKIKPDGTVKVLDFGIAKALDPRFLTGPGPAALTTPAMTEAGFILGTAAYMSPEQARGKFVDQRTDIWAFGCVLYEMLTGKPAFLGEDVTSTLARVLETPAKLDALPREVPPTVRRTLELCLEKDARKRIADMRDVKLALAGSFAVPAPTAPARARALPIAIAAAAAAALLTSAAWYLKPAPRPEPRIVTRFDYMLPPGIDLRMTTTSVLGIAPSGELFAFNGTEGIYVRRMGDAEARLIPGTVGAAPGLVFPDVVVSPDGRDVAYFRGPPGKLMKVSIDGGTPIAVADVAPVVPFGLSWEADGTMYYGQPDGIWRVSQNGGTPEHVVKTEAPEQLYGPHLLPGGQWLLFSVTKATGPERWNEADVVIQSVASGERRVLRSGAFDARYLRTGHLTYMVGKVLFASRFDVEALKLDDERVPLVDGVRAAAVPPGGSGFYAIANNGTLVFIPETAAAPTRPRPRRSVVWVDRAGNVTPLSVPPDDYTMARVSPDGTKIALVLGSALPLTEPPPDIYLFDLATENLTQLTFDPLSDDGPVWSRDGGTIYYRSHAGEGENGANLFALPAEGGTPQQLARPLAGARPMPWSASPDGGALLLVDAASLTDVNLATFDLAGNEGIKPLLNLAEPITEPSLSPNGQWLTYCETPSGGGPTEVNIRPYPDVRQQRRPIGPGRNPVFSRDGSEIVVFDGEGLSAASVQYSPVRIGPLKKLFRGRYWYGVAGPDGTLGRAWDVDSKNDRFLMITMPDENATAPEARTPQTQIKVVLNWFEELERRVPKR